MLFRIFHYPPATGRRRPGWGVGEHTDYGLLTMLAAGRHAAACRSAPRTAGSTRRRSPGAFVCNIGDMLERMTGGRYRSTPHRVRNLTGGDRLSFPFFFDPGWDAEVPPLPGSATRPGAGRRRRPLGRRTSSTSWSGTYGDYLTAKVARVFPDLA